MIYESVVPWRLEVRVTWRDQVLGCANGGTEIMCIFPRDSWKRFRQDPWKCRHMVSTNSNVWIQTHLARQNFLCLCLRVCCSFNVSAAQLYHEASFIGSKSGTQIQTSYRKQWKNLGDLNFSNNICSQITDWMPTCSSNPYRYCWTLCLAPENQLYWRRVEDNPYAVRRSIYTLDDTIFRCSTVPLTYIRDSKAGHLFDTKPSKFPAVSSSINVILS